MEACNGCAAVARPMPMPRPGALEPKKSISAAPSDSGCGEVALIEPRICDSHLTGTPMRHVRTARSVRGHSSPAKVRVLCYLVVRPHTSNYAMNFLAQDLRFPYQVHTAYDE